MPDRLWVTILSPRQVKRRYLSDKLKKTRMSKLALEGIEAGFKIACVYKKGLNFSGILSHNPYGLEDAQRALSNFLNNHKLNMGCVDMSHPDAFYFAYKEYNFM